MNCDAAIEKERSLSRARPRGQVSADVHAEGQALEGERDQPHDLPEYGSRTVADHRAGGVSFRSGRAETGAEL
jgi:hypothetical protein